MQRATFASPPDPDRDVRLFLAGALALGFVMFVAAVASIVSA